MVTQNAHDKVAGVSLLVISHSLFRGIKERVLATHGESCGFLAGQLDGQEAKVEQAFFVTNLAGSPDYFAISPQEHRQAEAMAEQNGRELIGVFHSHHRDPQPSAKDRENMRYYPLIWLILGETETRQLEQMVSLAFKPAREGPQPVAIHIE